MLKTSFFLILIYITLLLFLYIIQRQLIYFPDHSPPSLAHARMLGMQVVALQTNDGLELKAWYKPPTHFKLPTIIYFHGNAGNIAHRSTIVEPFLKEGYGVLLVTYRGYSQNPGTPHEEGLYKDARAALRFILEKNISLSCIALYGESIGTAVAIQMAIEYPVGGLILQSPFTSLGDIGQFHYPFLPVKWLIKDQFNSLEKASQIKAPTLILYGDQDDIIPSTFSIQLFEVIPSVKQIQLLPQTGHNDLFNAEFAIRFIKEHVKCQIK